MDTRVNFHVAIQKSLDQHHIYGDLLVSKSQLINKKLILKKKKRIRIDRESK